MSKPVTVVEHIVLFKIKDGTPEPNSESWMNRLRGLSHLDGIFQFHAGAALSSHPAGRWTHALYGRYRDKDALDAYSAHPMHLKVVADGSHMVEDKLAVDWEASVDSEALGSDCGASRVVLLKWQEGVSEDQIAKLLQQLADLPGITQHTAGPNFSPARAQGFQWGFAAQFGCVVELEKLQANDQLDHLLHSPIVDSFVLVDFKTGEGRTAKI